MRIRTLSSLLLAVLLPSLVNAFLNGWPACSSIGIQTARHPEAHSHICMAQRVNQDPSLSPGQRELNDEAKQGLEDFASECNSEISYFDPLGLADKQFWSLTNAETIAFLRHSEMKHGRIAMLGFFGYVVQANGLHFPWATEANGFPPTELSPPEQW